MILPIITVYRQSPIEYRYTVRVLEWPLEHVRGGIVHGAPQVYGLEDVHGLLGHTEIKDTKEYSHAYLMRINS